MFRISLLAALTLFIVGCSEEQYKVVKVNESTDGVGERIVRQLIIPADQVLDVFEFDVTPTNSVVFIRFTSREAKPGKLQFTEGDIINEEKEDGFQGELEQSEEN